MKTTLVAGGAGFIGSHLCESLLNQNYKVICVDNFITSDKKNIDRFIGNPNFIFIKEDITKHLQLKDNIDYVFHLASPASPNIKSPRSYMSFPLETLMANSEGTHRLLELSRIKNSKFLFASTSEVYGDPLESPQKENYFGNVNPNGVRSVYDESKRFGEAITMAYFRKFDLDTRIVRIFNTFGPFMQADDGRVVSNFIIQAISGKPLTVYGNGTQTRSFCYVDDMVEGLKLAMFSDNSKGEVINLGNSNEKTVLELAKLIKKLANSSSQIIFENLPQDDPKVRQPDVSKAKKILGWETKVDLEKGLLKTIEYFKSL